MQGAAGGLGDGGGAAAKTARSKGEQQHPDAQGLSQASQGGRMGSSSIAASSSSSAGSSGNAIDLIDSDSDWEEEERATSDSTSGVKEKQAEKDVLNTN